MSAVIDNFSSTQTFICTDSDKLSRLGLGMKIFVNWQILWTIRDPFIWRKKCYYAWFFCVKRESIDLKPVCQNI